MWKAVDNNYCDVVAHTLTEAIRLAEEAIKKRQPLSIALHGHAGEVYTTCVERDWIPDIVTDQTAAHDLLNGYIPTGMSIKQANQLRIKKPKEYRALAGASIVAQVNAMRRLQEVAQLYSSMAIICAGRQSSTAARMPASFMVLQLNTFAHFIVRGGALVAGLPYLETQTIFIRLMLIFLSTLRATGASSAGLSASRKASTFMDYRRGHAGLIMRSVCC